VEKNNAKLRTHPLDLQGKRNAWSIHLCQEEEPKGGNTNGGVTFIRRLGQGGAEGVGKKPRVTTSCKKKGGGEKERDYENFLTKK